jgi:hypothetical protein
MAVPSSRALPAPITSIVVGGAIGFAIAPYTTDCLARNTLYCAGASKIVARIR